MVYVQTQDGDSPRFEGRIVELGPSGDGFVIVRSGLREGDLVVTRGNFQIDSVLQIQAKQSMMNPAVGKNEGSAPTESVIEQIHLQGPSAEQLSGVYSAYFELASALADDDFATSLDAMQHTRTAVDLINSDELPEPIAAYWNDQKQSIDNALDTGQKAVDIETARGAFETVSIVLADLLRRSHIENLNGVYLAYCPMAFDFKGADWLTPEPQILNPYFGDRMLKCGTIKETLSPPLDNMTTDPSVSPDHGGHTHE